MTNYSPPLATFVRGSGVYLWDDKGKKYLDFLSGLAVTSLGHAHPAVTAAIKAQAGRLVHVSNFFTNEFADEVVQKLDRLLRVDYKKTQTDSTGSDGSSEMPTGGVNAADARTADVDWTMAATSGDAGRILFQNSGAEAIEAAVKLVRKYQGIKRHTVVSAERSFHGRTFGALAATGQPEKQKPFKPLPDGFRHVPFNDIDALVEVLDSSVGAVLLESIQGEGGVIPASTEYLAAVQEVCNDRGILLVMDEIQTGLARTGRWFGYQHAGIEPDIVAMAKALGNGMPVGALWARKDIAAAFKPGDHGSTFAGQPLALSAVAAVIETMTTMNAPAVAGRLGAHLRGMLSELQGVGHVRGRGLLLGVEISEEALAGRTAKDVTTLCRERGLIVNAVNDTALRLAPPLIATEAHISAGVEIIGGVLKYQLSSSPKADARGVG
ncbi:MAG: aminotransferase class III-fold pyridoxal phosphate-dependent enzyme [Acidimicrobiaceae bacterium]|nr:aminotransferase class III-fold pyridoxal phosphate-dependent enzyme [Acidimicrobiaceae bacterium]